MKSLKLIIKTQKIQRQIKKTFNIRSLTYRIVKWSNSMKFHQQLTVIKICLCQSKLPNESCQICSDILSAKLNLKDQIAIKFLKHGQNSNFLINAAKFQLSKQFALNGIRQIIKLQELGSLTKLVKSQKNLVISLISIKAVMGENFQILRTIKQKRLLYIMKLTH